MSTPSTLPNPLAAAAPARLPDRLAHRYAESLRAGDGRAAAAIVRRALDSGVEPTVVHNEVIAPAMRTIGTEWEAGRLSVADEHLATAITHRVMVDVYDALMIDPPRARERVLLTGLQGQHHVLGLRMIADQLEGAGFDVLFLGADVPLRDLLEAVGRHRPALVGLSVVRASEADQARAAIRQLRAATGGVPVLLGGPAASTDFGIEGVELVGEGDSLLGAVERALRDAPAPAPGPTATVIPFVRVVPADDDGTMESRFAENAAAMGDVVRQRTRRAAEFQRLALEDGVTGLPNRRALDDFLDRLTAPERAARAILMIDVDRFKQVNDEHGHQAGDAVLARVAQIIRDVCGPRDFAARYGGDEFAIVLEAEPEAAAGVGEALRVAVGADGGKPPITVSIGVSGFSGDLRATALRADMALYRAKARGRNGVELTS